MCAARHSGEATCATAEKLVRVLSKLTTYLPAMGGWQGRWTDEFGTRYDAGSQHDCLTLCRGCARCTWISFSKARHLCAWAFECPDVQVLRCAPPTTW